MNKTTTLLLLTTLLLAPLAALHTAEVASPSPGAIADGPFKPTFESLKQYQVPEWCMDAKLGIFMHWGPASVGGTSGWFGREMYRQGSDSYKFVVKNFGHPSKFGYKDLCKLFKAENFDDAQADALVKLYKKAGARYVVPVAVHHDNFDMWDSKYQPCWNAKVTTGKDIIGIWKKAADANGLRFGVASHVARTYRWFLTSHQADKAGPLKGVPYDGADPQFSDLYGVPWKSCDPTFPGWSGDCAYEVSHDVGPPEWERQFERRMRDLLDRYQPDLYYIDGGIPFHVHPAGLNILADYYNSSIAHHDGKLEAVASIKCDWRPNIAVLDYEGAAKGGMPEYYWQSDQSINGEWFWTRYDKPQEYTSAKRIIATLMDNISRKGNLLLNLPLKPDGTFDPAVIKILEEMGQCTGTIGEAIYGTRAWEVFGEGPTDFSKGFAAGTARDIRFTRNKANTVLYATMLDWPGNAATLTITTLKAGRFDAGAIATISMLGAPGNLTWKQDDAGLHVTLPDAAPGADAYSLKMTFETTNIPNLRTCPTAPKGNTTAGSLTIDVGNPSHAISPSFYGMMTEEINHAYDGGLYAELIQNRAFKDNPTQPVHWSVVQDGGSGSMAIDKIDPLTPALSSSLRLSIQSASGTQRVGIANDGFWGIPVKPHTTYRVSFYAEAADGFSGPLTVAIESKDGATVAARATLPEITPRWKKYETTLTTGDVAPSLDNRFVISAAHAGTVRFSLVSLFPPTYKNRPNGNRIDLMQKLADMHPAFLRLPGGNYLDPGHYIWKNTIGPLENRPGNPGAWGYRTSEGLGILEFLEWCEDLKIEPIFGVSDGRGWLPDNADVGPLVQDALDEIEYITGGPETTCGAKRIAHGHFAAFPLHYVEIGNEDATPPYATRFVKFYDTIRGKYPKLKIIHNQLVRDLSSLARIPDVIDDHFYDPPNRMERRATHYDKYPRTAPKVFVEEWATVDWSYSGTPNFEESLADAAWMTGLERNSDVVIMHCYAPLLVNMNKGGMQWPVNLIGYDALDSFGSPSYYAQKMFAANRGDVVLPLSMAPASLLPPVPLKIFGGIGVDTWDGKAEIQDVRVISGDAILYRSDFANGMKGWKQRDDKWKVQNGVLANTGAGRATVGDDKWTDYAFGLKVRKTNNNNVYILFHVRGEHEYLEWEISNRGRTTLEKHDADFRRTISQEIPFKFQTGPWYNLRVELKKDNIRCFVDDTLVIDMADNQQTIPPIPPLYAAASRENASGDVILKVVNVGSDSQPLTVTFKGIASVLPNASGELLTGNPKDQNSLEQPTMIVPRHLSITDAATTFRHGFPGYSISVIRFKVK